MKHQHKLTTRQQGVTGFSIVDFLANKNISPFLTDRNLCFFTSESTSKLRKCEKPIRDCFWRPWGTEPERRVERFSSSMVSLLHPGLPFGLQTRSLYIHRKHPGNSGNQCPRR